MTRAERIEEAATRMADIWDRATMDYNSRDIAMAMGHENYRAMFDAWSALRAATALAREDALIAVARCLNPECVQECGDLRARVATLGGAAQTAASLLTSMFYAPPEVQPQHYAMLARDALLAALAPAPASKGDE